MLKLAKCDDSGNGQHVKGWLIYLLFIAFIFGRIYFSFLVKETMPKIIPYKDNGIHKLKQFKTKTS